MQSPERLESAGKVWDYGIQQLFDMKMNVATRLAILTNLPEQGSVLEMISARNIRKKIDQWVY